MISNLLKINRLSFSTQLKKLIILIVNVKKQITIP